MTAARHFAMAELASIRKAVRGTASTDPRIDDPSTSLKASILDPVFTYVRDAQRKSTRIDSTQTAEQCKSHAPKLTSRHLPSAKPIFSLQPVTLKQLGYDQRNHGKVIYIVTQTDLVFNGMHLVVRDTDGEQGLLWSLIAYPCLGGAASMTRSTIVAVKEPLYKAAPTAGDAICVHHPTDLVRVSRFDPFAIKLFGLQLATENTDFALGGDLCAFVGNLMEAVDAYSEGIRRLVVEDKSSSSEAAHAAELLEKRASAYFWLSRHTEALQDANQIFTADPNHKQALKLASASAIALGRCDEAQGYVRRLKDDAPRDKATLKLARQATLRSRQATGDIDFDEIANAISRFSPVTNAMTFEGDIEVRESTLAGRGMFATKHIKQGQLLLCEKPVAFSSNILLSTFPWGVDALMSEMGWTNRRNMSFHQQLAADAVAHPELIPDIFDLHAGPNYRTDQLAQPVFDSYRAMHVISFNHHNTYSEKPSTNHGLLDPSEKEQRANALIPEDNTPGLWHQTSMFNHSCLPNSTMMWLGDLMIVQALSDIKANEELTLSFTLNRQPYEARKQDLARYGFECHCLLCKGEATLPRQVQGQRQVIAKFEDKMVQHVQSNKNPDGVPVHEIEDIVRKSLRSYSTDVYKGLPYLQMTTMLFKLGHIYLGDVDGWHKASKDARLRGAECFTASIQLGLRLKLVRDRSSAYCELVFLRYAQKHDVGVSALVGLAELAITSSDELDQKRSVSLLACAKKLYKVCYGEAASFDKHQLHYSCKAVAGTVKAPSPPPNWEKVKAAALAAPSPIPAFLR